MICDRELWACADHVLSRHGDRCAEFLAERVADLASQGDQAGVATWIAIADRVDRLQDRAGPGQARH
jgi:hypothetical protein